METDGQATAPGSALALILVREIGQALAAFAESGEPAAIDLRGLPMSDADREELLAWLGDGEIAATLAVAGRSEIRETRFTGVWWVRHFGTDDRIAAERIEIASVPDILIADMADVTAAAARFDDELAELSIPPSMEEAEHV
ncbi:MAG: hydrogenase expression/formation protein [Phyllobacteriaceae bacterium]|nr:hydrogenase expression/formation protein [Phyllobacteriaceae bacterium]